jgi:hypothetical protein
MEKKNWTTPTIEEFDIKEVTTNSNTGTHYDHLVQIGDPIGNDLS